MKFVDSKLIQKYDGRKRGKYLITLEVTDHDIEMFEDFATVYVTKKPKPECEFKEKYQKWMKKVWHCFWKLWKLYD